LGRATNTKGKSALGNTGEVSRSSDNAADAFANRSSSELNSLANIFSDPLIVIHFQRFAESAFDAEAVHFLLACQEYFGLLKSSTVTVAQLVCGAQQIFDEYIVDGASQQVNIGSTLRMESLAALTELRLTTSAQKLKPATSDLKAKARACFHSALKEVYSLVQVNSYARFLKSAAAARCENLIRWTEGFDELDDQEQTGMLRKLTKQQQQSRRIAEDTEVRSKNTSTYESRAPKQNEADIFNLEPSAPLPATKTQQKPRILPAGIGTRGRSPSPIDENGRGSSPTVGDTPPRAPSPNSSSRAGARALPHVLPHSAQTPTDRPAVPSKLGQCVQLAPQYHSTDPPNPTEAGASNAASPSAPATESVIDIAPLGVMQLPGAPEIGHATKPDPDATASV
jgi:hypothetical protein